MSCIVVDAALHLSEWIMLETIEHLIAGAFHDSKFLFYPRILLEFSLFTPPSIQNFQIKPFHLNNIYLVLFFAFLFTPFPIQNSKLSFF